MISFPSGDRSEPSSALIEMKQGALENWMAGTEARKRAQTTTPSEILQVPCLWAALDLSVRSGKENLRVRRESSKSAQQRRDH